MCSVTRTIANPASPVAAALGNTPAIARKSYVHPALVDLVKEGQVAFREQLRLPRATRWMSRYERGFLAFMHALTPVMAAAA